MVRPFIAFCGKGAFLFLLNRTRCKTAKLYFGGMTHDKRDCKNLLPLHRSVSVRKLAVCALLSAMATTPDVRKLWPADSSLVPEGRLPNCRLCFASFALGPVYGVIVCLD